MSLHGTVLWLHIVAAILLVGGSAWTHVAATRLRRSRTVAEAQAHASTVQGFVQASMPLAVATLVAGAYLATVGSYWSSPWLVTSLVLFAVIGALFGSQVDPAVTDVVAALDAAAPGPVPDAVAARTHGRSLTMVPAIAGGFDLVIVFLMSNKPGLTASLLVAGLGLAVGLVLASREQQAVAVAT